MSRSEAAPPQKTRLRAHFRARRDALDPQQAHKASESICRRLQRQDELHSIHHLAGYAALGQEIDVRSYLQHSLNQGIAVYLPRVTGPGTMEFCAIGSWDALKEGAFGIREPTGPAVSTDRIEVFLVPGLAFDRRGHRLGFGKGFYDRALPPMGEALAIGVCHHWQLVDDDLPAEDHDRAMDFIMTDQIRHQPRHSSSRSTT